MKYFLAKSDPDAYSINDLKRDKNTVWDGVHSYQAIINIKKMKKGDRMFIYHSQGENSIVGLAEITSDAYENTKDPRMSWVVEIKFLKQYEDKLTLKEIKQSGEFNDWALVRQGRLSTMEVPEKFIKLYSKKLEL